MPRERSIAANFRQSRRGLGKIAAALGVYPRELLEE